MQHKGYETQNITSCSLRARGKSGGGGAGPSRLVTGLYRRGRSTATQARRNTCKVEMVRFKRCKIYANGCGALARCAVLELS